MFEKYPKKRPELPLKYKEVYEEHYKSNRQGATIASSMSQYMERWLHKKLSSDSSFEKSTLEIGAGTLNHLSYEKIGEYDVIEPMQFLYTDSPHLSEVGNIYTLIEDVPYENKYDRIISCAVLEHIDNLPYVISKSGLLLEKNGIFRASIPSYGGLLWKVAYSLTTGIEFWLRYKLRYSVIMNHEHINTASEIENILRYFFHNIRIKRLGIGHHFSLYTFIEASMPDMEKCKAYLADYDSPLQPLRESTD